MMKARWRSFYVRHRLACMCVFALAIVMLTVVAAYLSMAHMIKTAGIQLQASARFPVPDAAYYMQDDPKWADEVIGNSVSKMGSAGCLVSGVASAMTYLGTPVTPAELNRVLTEISGFDDASLTWYKVHDAYSTIDYRYANVFTRDTIEKDLGAGLWPIVRVKYHHTGVSHWVLIVGAEDSGEFLIFDPLHKGNEPIALSTHGNVYAYRVMVRAK